MDLYNRCLGENKAKRFPVASFLVVYDTAFSVSWCWAALSNLVPSAANSLPQCGAVKRELDTPSAYILDGDLSLNSSGRPCRRTYLFHTKGWEVLSEPPTKSTIPHTKF